MCHGAEEAVPMTHYLLFSGVPSGREKLKEIVDQQNNNRQNRDQDDEDQEYRQGIPAGIAKLMTIILRLRG